jgi:hypothetical protein
MWKHRNAGLAVRKMDKDEIDRLLVSKATSFVLPVAFLHHHIFQLKF